MKITTKLIVFKYSWEEETDSFRTLTYSENLLKDPDYVIHDVVEVEVEFTPASKQKVTQMQIDNLQAEKEAIFKTASKRAEELDDKIQRLMALPSEVHNEEDI